MTTIFAVFRLPQWIIIYVVLLLKNVQAYSCWFVRNPVFPVDGCDGTNHRNPFGSIIVAPALSERMQPVVNEYPEKSCHRFRRF